jgi:hypothetical protein
LTQFLCVEEETNDVDANQWPLNVLLSFTPSPLFPSAPSLLSSCAHLLSLSLRAPQLLRLAISLDDRLPLAHLLLRTLVLDQSLGALALVFGQRRRESRRGAGAARGALHGAEPLGGVCAGLTLMCARVRAGADEGQIAENGSVRKTVY